jgi:arylsulfatase A-like enzyme
MQRHNENTTRRAFLKAATMTAVGAGASSLIPGCEGSVWQRRAKLADRSDATLEILPKPNIIFILADDLGYGDLGCYGQKTIQTPNIDQMAAKGVIFTDAYAGCTVCAPSRCALMTGLDTGHCLIRGNDRVPLRPSDTTVAKELKTAGYTTGIIGKWGLGEPDTTGIPNRQGFDYWFGYLNQRHAHNYYPDYLWRNEEKVSLPNEVRPVNPPGGVATKRVEYSHDLFSQEALDFVEKHKKEPFFLYLAYTIPHANNEDRPNGMEVPSYGPYEKEDWPLPEKGYAAMITRMDADVGRLMVRLKALGLDKKTIVFFSSDNGPHKEGGADPTFFKSSGPFRGYKRALYEGGIRVPLIARWPGRIAPGSRSNHVCAFWDFLPTCCDLAGIAPSSPTDGISIVPTLLGHPKHQKRHAYLYWEFHEEGKKQAVRMGDWKAVRLNVATDPDDPIELYNLKTDPGETTDIAARNPKVVAQIVRTMKIARSPSEHWPLP